MTFLVYSPYPRYSGGRENWLYNLSGALVQRGRKVSIVSYASNRRTFYPPVPGIKVVTLPSIRFFDSVFLWVNRFGLGLPNLVDVLVLYPVIAAWHLVRTRPRRLVCMNSIPEGLAGVIARGPFTVSVRGDVPKEMSRGFGLAERVFAALERWVLRRARRVLANGADTQARLLQGGIASEVIPNGVDLRRFRARDTQSEVASRLRAAAAGRPIIAVIGTLRPVKGTGHAVDCAAELKRMGVSFLMAIVGKGAVDHYRRVAHAQGLDDVVWFSGETNDVPSVLGSADLFLALSGGSGLSMAVLEALAAGVPVIALDSPVYTQLITHRVNGWLAAPTELAPACRELLADADLRHRLGAEGARTADHYDWPLVADRLVTVLAGE